MSNTQLAGGLIPGNPSETGVHRPAPVAPFAVQAGEGAALETPIGDVLTVKAATRQTNGSLTVLELVIGPKKGPALHTHLREDELWYVIEGDFRFKAGGAMLRASTGGMAFGPRGTPHAFQNIGETPGRLLVVTTPTGSNSPAHRSGSPIRFLPASRNAWAQSHGPSSPPPPEPDRPRRAG